MLRPVVVFLILLQHAAEQHAACDKQKICADDDEDHSHEEPYDRVKRVGDAHGKVIRRGEDHDARKAEQKEAAEAALKKWEKGARTEDSFAELANELSADTGSNTNGALYTEVYKGQMVTEFNDWCFDESRQPGDTGIVYNEGSYTGYHVIYFVGTDAPYWQVQVRNAMKNADYTQWNNDLVKDITATEASGMKYLV